MNEPDEIDNYIIELFIESLPEDTNFIITNLDTNEVIYEHESDDS